MSKWPTSWSGGSGMQLAGDALSLPRPRASHPAMKEIREQFEGFAAAAIAMKRRHEWEQAHPGKPYANADSRSYGCRRFADEGEIIGWQAVRLTLDSYRRGLALLDRVLAETVTAGFSLSFDNPRWIVLTRDGSVVWLQLREKVSGVFTECVDRHKMKYTKRDRTMRPTGQLSFFITQYGGGANEVKEDSSVEFADLVKRVSQTIERRHAGGRAYAQARLASEAMAELERKEAVARAEVERLRQEEKARVATEARRRRRELFLDAANWQQAQSIRLYLIEMDRRLADGAVPMDGYDQWRKWAETTADALADAAIRTHLRER
ncbi:hypothetical protein PQR33_14910 [Paraburkholderia sediminicola]|uniref:hypothetical protein n=1 Tax=Paraburkholderia sediminicola TaxID=458836 RepID=UPI0038BA17C6